MLTCINININADSPSLVQRTATRAVIGSQKHALFSDYSDQLWPLRGSTELWHRMKLRETVLGSTGLIRSVPKMYRGRYPALLPREVYQTGPTGKRPPGRPLCSWRKYISALAEERLGIPESELANAAGERKTWSQMLDLLPPRPDPGRSGRRSK